MDSVQERKMEPAAQFTSINENAPTPDQSDKVVETSGTSDNADVDRQPDKSKTANKPDVKAAKKTNKSADKPSPKPPKKLKPPVWPFKILLPDTITPKTPPTTQVDGRLIGKKKHENYAPKRQLKDLKTRYHANINCFVSEVPIKTIEDSRTLAKSEEADAYKLRILGQQGEYLTAKANNSLKALAKKYEKIMVIRDQELEDLQALQNLYGCTIDIDMTMTTVDSKSADSDAAHETGKKRKAQGAASEANEGDNESEEEDGHDEKQKKPNKSKMTKKPRMTKKIKKELESRNEDSDSDRVDGRFGIGKTPYTAAHRARMESKLAIFGPFTKVETAKPDNAEALVHVDGGLETTNAEAPVHLEGHLENTKADNAEIPVHVDGHLGSNESVPAESATSIDG